MNSIDKTDTDSNEPSADPSPAGTSSVLKTRQSNGNVLFTTDVVPSFVTEEWLKILLPPSPVVCRRIAKGLAKTLDGWDGKEVEDNIFIKKLLSYSNVIYIYSFISHVPQVNSKKRKVFRDYIQNVLFEKLREEEHPIMEGESSFTSEEAVDAFVSIEAWNEIAEMLFLERQLGMRDTLTSTMGEVVAAHPQLDKRIGAWWRSFDESEEASKLERSEADEESENILENRTDDSDGVSDRSDSGEATLIADWREKINEIQTITSEYFDKNPNKEFLEALSNLSEELIEIVDQYTTISFPDQKDALIGALEAFTNKAQSLDVYRVIEKRLLVVGSHIRALPAESIDDECRTNIEDILGSLGTDLTEIQCAEVTIAKCQQDKDYSGLVTASQAAATTTQHIDDTFAAFYDLFDLSEVLLEDQEQVQNTAAKVADTDQEQFTSDGGNDKEALKKFPAEADSGGELKATESESQVSSRSEKDEPEVKEEDVSELVRDEEPKSKLDENVVLINLYLITYCKLKSDCRLLNIQSFHQNLEFLL